MITYSIALSTLQQMTGVLATDTISSALLMQFFNDSRRTVAGIRGGTWAWLEHEDVGETTADQNYVYIPNDFRKVTAIRVVVSSGSSATVYLPVEICDIKKWQVVLASRLGSNQYPYFAYQQGEKILFSPIPSEDGVEVFFTGPRKIVDLNQVDYTTGTIVSVALGSNEVVGSGTSWTTGMVGRYIRITSTAAANGGDGEWYEVGGLSDATHLTLVKNYQGASITAGSAAYILGQVTYEPETWQMAPIYRALALYWGFKENTVLAKQYWMSYDGGQEQGLRDDPTGMIGQMLAEAAETFDGNYIAPTDKDLANVQIAPYYQANQQATGFN